MTLSVTVNVLLLIAAASSWKLLSRSFRQISRTHIAKMSLVNNYEESLMDDQRTPFSIGTVIGNEFENVVYNTNLTKSLRFSGHFSKQHVIKFSTPPKRVFVLVKPEEEVLEPFKHAVRRLCGLGMTVFADEINYSYLYDECYDEFKDLFDKQASTDPSSGNHDSSKSNNCSLGSIRLLTNQTLPTVDLIITFGGDGLLMHVNTLFESARAMHAYETRTMPPIMSFDFGSLGFLAPFQFEDFDAEVDYVLNNAALLTLRQRLKCTMWKAGVNSGTFHVLNEAVIDRGPSPYLSAIQLTCDGQYLTTVQGDGVIIATPTGSTAYSLAAGGSMVHPSVPAMLLTPICAHTLSFRPLMLPDSSVLSCEVPADSRATAWVCFDGKFRQELQRGDRLDIQISSVPLPTINRKNFTGDWFDALRNGFMFNQRPRQKPISNTTKKANDTL